MQLRGPGANAHPVTRKVSAADRVQVIGQASRLGLGIDAHATLDGALVEAARKAKLSVITDLSVFSDT